MININIGFDYNVFHYYIKEKNLHGKIAYSRDKIQRDKIKFQKNYAQLFKENKVMKYNMTICNGQHTYILKELYQQMGKKKE